MSIGIGDEVVCVRLDRSRSLTKGKVYRISNLSSISGALVMVSGHVSWYPIEYFDIAPKTPVQTTKTIVTGVYGPVDVYRYDPNNDTVSIRIATDPMTAKDIREAIKHLTTIAEFMEG